MTILDQIKLTAMSNLSRDYPNTNKLLFRYKPGVQPLALDADVSELLTTGALKPRRRTTLNE
jgi:hypothetical protein